MENFDVFLPDQTYNTIFCLFYSSFQKISWKESMFCETNEIQ